MDKEKVLSRMMKQCSMREYCISDISRKLACVEGLLPGDRDEILTRLVEDGFLDENRYACAFARDKSSLNGWGSLKIKLALQRKGIPARVIESALLQVDTAKAQDKLSSLLLSKIKSLSGETDPMAVRAKVFRYAMGRGYSYQDIIEVYDNIRRD